MVILKGFSSVILVAFALPVLAQSSQMSEEQMNRMMQGMGQMANCFQSLDQQKLQAMAEEGKQKHNELEQLCANGERDRAQREAMEFGLRYLASEEFQELKKCGEMAQGVMPQMPDYSVYAEEGGENVDNRHICDDI